MDGFAPLNKEEKVEWKLRKTFDGRDGAVPSAAIPRNPSPLSIFLAIFTGDVLAQLASAQSLHNSTLLSF
jgi:hypothetical protein